LKGTNMTIAIKITNADSRETAVVAVKRQFVVDGQATEDCEQLLELKGGEETTCHVHSGQRLVVEEVKNG
jgi:hypothetical protein